MVKTTTPKVSVIVPFFGDYRDFDKRALMSLENQTFKDFELIFILDGPSPYSNTLKKQIKNSKIRYKFLESQENLGALMSRIFASRNASGDYLAFLDHDDFFPENFLEIMYNLAFGIRVDVVECPIWNVKLIPGGIIKKEKKFWHRFKCDISLYNRDIIKSYLLYKSHNNLCNKLIKRKVYEDAVNELLIDFGEAYMTMYDDALVTSYIYNISSSYHSTCQTHYYYITNHENSNMNSRNIKVIINKLSKTHDFFKSVKRRFYKEFGGDIISNFYKKEAVWAINHFQSLEKRIVSGRNIVKAFNRLTLKVKILRMKIDVYTECYSPKELFLFLTKNLR